ncbi:MAG: chitobiase/beta-hexosaminidase C-terminal domain-containing protein, partial [Opitutaceae bacterium]
MTPIHCFRTFFRRRILAAGFFVVASTATSWAQTGSIAAPTFSEPTGTYTKEVHVRISDATNGVSLYYTTNGTTPTASSPPVPGKTIEFKGTTTLEAIAILGGVSSSVTSATYTFSGTGGTTVATPMFSPGAGTYASAQAVTISDSTNGASIYYTTNGTAPTTSSTVYRGPISIGSGTVTIEAMAALSGDLNSAVATAAYTIGAPPPPVVA